MLTTFFVLILFSTITIPSYSARTLLDLGTPPQPQPLPSQTYQPTITFLMQDILARPTEQTTTTINSNPQNLPFSKPMTNLPSIQGGIPFSSQTTPNYDYPSTQTLGIAFPTSVGSLREEMEFGQVIDIEEDMYEDKAMFGVVGKVEGVFVEIGSEGENMKKYPSYMMALTTSFLGDMEGNYDSLKFFGVHRRDVLECHVAVIGGTGKFEDANGYAIVKVFTEESSEGEPNKEFLLFNVYLS